MDITRHLSRQIGVAAILSACYYLLFGTANDAYVLVAVTLWKRWQKGQTLVPLWHDYSYDTQVLYSVVAALGVFYLIRRWCLSSTQGSSGQTAGPLRPLLFPCQTTHTRLFPKKHSFKYSYLMVGVPVDWQGNAGGMIATGPPNTARNGWYQIHSADYLQRGSGHLTLREKLDKYFLSQVRPSLTQLVFGVADFFTGRRPCSISLCIPCHCGQTARLPLQSCFILVFILCREEYDCHDIRGQQYF
jgi:hypothetical protein